MGGVAIQQFFILVFFFYAIKFHKKIQTHIRQGVEGVSSVLPLLHALYAVLLLITVHCSILLQAKALTFCPDANCLSACRVLPWSQEQHS
jgi:hypothetical protein